MYAKYGNLYLEFVLCINLTNPSAHAAVSSEHTHPEQCSGA